MGTQKGKGNLEALAVDGMKLKLILKKKNNLYTSKLDFNLRK